ncbi:hypothetical protein MARPO_0250s0002 [Marchantia polymorpha]|uniref:Uncharacterized protein n=1 Tax=Marchantia polymorpha TaxID=3197 RepID=A0A2R6VZF6_MARPO|nr:hypothetical protein MARPO_0250s0002 [Marchantia polymorpha]|eukprot:PTQ26980.1 hypothetical protein MARPO_0250s0002 [Marchantia polymorpha]
MEGSSSSTVPKLPLRRCLEDISNSSGRTCLLRQSWIFPLTQKGRRRLSQDAALRAAVEKFKGGNGKQIAAKLPNRSDVKCLHRGQKVLDPALVKGYWTKEEDDKLLELVNTFCTKRWLPSLGHCLVEMASSVERVTLGQLLGSKLLVPRAFIYKVAQMAGIICGAGLVKDCPKLHSRSWVVRRIPSVQISTSAHVQQQKSSKISYWFTWRGEEKWGMGEQKNTKYKFPAGKGGREGKSPMVEWEWGELKREGLHGRSGRSGCGPGRAELACSPHCPSGLQFSLSIWRPFSSLAVESTLHKESARLLSRTTSKFKMTRMLASSVK